MSQRTVTLYAHARSPVSTRHSAEHRNIGRLCVGLGAHLPDRAMWLRAVDKALRRAGLDYWPHLSWTHDSGRLPSGWVCVSRGWCRSIHRAPDQVHYQAEDVLLLDGEQRGLPAEWRQRYAHRLITIPVLGPIRLQFGQCLRSC